MDVVEHLVRTFARRTTQNGSVVLVSNGIPALVQAFQHLGWSDPYPDPELLPKKPVRAFEKATVSSPERAVLSGPKGRTDGGL